MRAKQTKAALLRIIEALGLDPAPDVTAHRGVAHCTLREKPLLMLGCARVKDETGAGRALCCTLLTPSGDARYDLHDEHYSLRSDRDETALLARLREILSIDSDAPAENAAPHPYQLKVTVLEERPGGTDWQSLGETTVEI